MSVDTDKQFVSNKELAAELRSLRWEMRFLIAAANLGALALAYGLNVPPVPQAVSLIVSLA